VKVRMVNDIAILAPHGWLMGGDETEDFETAIRKLLEEGNRTLLVNLGDVSMMNSTALGVLTGCRTSYVNREGRVALCNLDKKLDHIFVITRLALLFDTYPSEKEALAALAVKV
jgi:anti-sigma B factor antagonist